jgi:hypothetical protein
MIIAPGTHNYRKIKPSSGFPSVRWFRITPEDNRIVTIGINYRPDDPDVFAHYELLKTRYGTWLSTWKGESGSIYFDIEVPRIHVSDIEYNINRLIKPKHTV